MLSFRCKYKFYTLNGRDYHVTVKAIRIVHVFLLILCGNVVRMIMIYACAPVMVLLQEIQMKLGFS